MSLSRKILSAIFLFFIIYAAVMLPYYPTSESAWIILLASAFFLLLTLFWKAYTKLVKKYSLFKILTFIMVLCLIFFVSVEVLIISHENMRYSGDADVVLILGAGIKGNVPSGSLKYRLDSALEYLSEHEDALVVVSGGAASSDSASEASVMRDYLVEAGVSEEMILLEEKSSNTYENFAFTKNILDELYKEEKYKIVYVTSAFHVYRSGEIAKDLSLEAHGIASPSTWYMLPIHHVREFLSVVNMWLGIF